MGRIAVAASSQRVIRQGTNVTEVVIEAGDLDDATVDWYGHPGIDAPPMRGDYIVVTRVPGNEDAVAVGAVDPLNAGVAEPGEIYIIARDSSGAPKAHIRLYADGSIEVSNDNGNFKLDAAGQFSANDNFTVDP